MSRLLAIADQGQSIWLDYIRRDFVDGKGLSQLVAEDGLKGLTSNPAIFEKAIAASNLYDASLHGHVRLGQRDPQRLVELLVIEDIRMAADVLYPVYQQSERVDGYVSLEVSARIAEDSTRTIEEGRRLWHTVGRPNLMIKVPGTAAGAVAVRQLIAEGINVNVTLLFSRAAAAAVADAYLQGLEERVARGEPVADVASVASFFISRIDTAMDAAIAASTDAAAKVLTSRIAIANAKLAYQDHLARCDSLRWKKLAALGARPQRLLWASTGTKNPQLRDTLYIEQLIGPDTVNTVPPATLDAFRDHGEAARTVDADVADAAAVMAAVEQLGLPFAATTERLLIDGVKLFVDAGDQLLAAVTAKRDALERMDAEPDTAA